MVLRLKSLSEYKHLFSSFFSEPLLVCKTVLAVAYCGTAGLMKISTCTDVYLCPR